MKYVIARRIGRRPNVNAIELDSDNILTPATGDRYIINGTGDNDFAGQDMKIAQYNGTSWTFIQPQDGDIVYVDALNSNYQYDADTNTWNEASVPDQELEIEDLVVSVDSKLTLGTEPRGKVEVTVFDINTGEYKITLVSDLTNTDMSITGTEITLVSASYNGDRAVVKYLKNL
jgi:hypothetical protein